MSSHQTPHAVATRHLTPVEVCLQLIGPLPVLEGIVGYQPKAGYTWLSNTKNRDAGDFPTARLMRRLLAFAAANGIPLSADMLINGASSAEIEALIAARADGTAALARAEVAARAHVEAAE